MDRDVAAHLRGSFLRQHLEAKVVAVVRIEAVLAVKVTALEPQLDGSGLGEPQHLLRNVVGGTSTELEDLGSTAIQGTETREHPGVLSAFVKLFLACKAIPPLPGQGPLRWFWQLVVQRCGNTSPLGDSSIA